MIVLGGNVACDTIGCTFRCVDWDDFVGVLARQAVGAIVECFILSYRTSLAGAIGFCCTIVLKRKARRAGSAIVFACICGGIDGLEFSCHTSRAGPILASRAVVFYLRSLVTGSAPSGAWGIGSRSLEGSGRTSLALFVVGRVP